MNNLLKIAQSASIITLFTATLFLGFLFITQQAEAQYGSSCSEYGVMAYESGGYCKCMSGYVMGEGILGSSYCISEDQSCKDQYGYNAKANYAGNCECRSGYVFEDSYSGKQCVSADSVCHDDYGIMSRYDSLSGSCECSYGYVFGKDSIGRTQCITDDKACQNQLGYNSSASYGGQCECDSGYVIEDGQCVDGDRVCRSDHGIYSSYNDYGNKCECDDDYTFDDDNQCVEKHNSAYFTLLDISEDGDELLVQSQHDYQNYIIEFGMGCWDYAIESYEDSSLIINMGTDFSVDTFDTLVLPNHDQNCSIMGVDWTSDDSFPESEEDEVYYYTPPAPAYTPPVTTPDPVYIPEPVVTEPIVEPVEIVANEEDEVSEPEIAAEEMIMENATTSIENVLETEEKETEDIVVEEGFFKKIISFFKGWF